MQSCRNSSLMRSLWFVARLMSPRRIWIQTIPTLLLQTNKILLCSLVCMQVLQTEAQFLNFFIFLFFYFVLNYFFYFYCFIYCFVLNFIFYYFLLFYFLFYFIYYFCLFYYFCLPKFPEDPLPLSFIPGPANTESRCEPETK